MHVGDTVAVVSPSFGAVGRWPHRVERATAYLKSLGLEVRLMPNAARSDGWASAPADARVADLHGAFADDDVAVVLCGIGGIVSNELLPLLDYDLIRDRPKIFQGYSDITVLHWALAKHAGASLLVAGCVTARVRLPSRTPIDELACRRSIGSNAFGPGGLQPEVS